MESQMRAFDGQRSDNKPIQRSREEKKKQLEELRLALAGLKPHASPLLRDSMLKRVADLELELARGAGTSREEPQVEAAYRLGRHRR